MFCPNCGQEKLSPDTNFCSRCGFLLTGTLELLQSGGVTATAAKSTSPRARGLKQGLFIFLLTFLVVPIVAIVTLAVEAREPFIVAITAILLFVGGLLRMAYALMFEEGGGKTAASTDDFLTAAQGHLSKPSSAGALPPQQSVPASAYAAPHAGNWRDTNDLQPVSVTEGTTRLLEKDETPQ